MYGAGQRTTRPPDRYNPSAICPSPILPSTDFDLNMTGPDDIGSTPSRHPPATLQSFSQLMDDMNHTFHNQLEKFSQKFTELDVKLDELCVRVDEIDCDTTQKLSQINLDVESKIVNMQSQLSELKKSIGATGASTLAQSINHVNSVQRAISDNIQQVSDRVCGVEGQASRLAAIENRINDPTLHPSTSHFSQQSHVSFGNLPSSTLNQSNPPQNPCSQNKPSEINHSGTLSSAESLNINNMSHNNTPTTLNISLDPSRIPQYNGSLFPTHPSDFIDRVDKYFLTYNVPDRIKINFVTDNFSEKAQLWYTTLLPPPTVYSDFVSLFINYFWSSSLQRSIRNDLYRPYSHNDSSTMAEHAMDWINRARHLSPPLDQAEMIDQIVTHFPYNIALALRGLHLTTTNSLVQELTYLQCTHPPRNNHNPNAYPNNNHNRYPSNNTHRSRQDNNYSNRYSNSNQRPHNNSHGAHAQSNHTITPPGN